MFTKSARFYDVIYNWKNYAAEVERLRTFIDQHQRSEGSALLDVACGTGKHLEYLKPYFTCEGLDLDGELLAVARQRLPEITFHQEDMTAFTLGREYDVVTCLFSAIGYVQTVERLNAAIGAMARHLKAGGVLLVEPWLDPSVFTHGHVHMLNVDEPDLKITRMSYGEVRGTLSILNFSYLVGVPGQGVNYFTELHEMGLFTKDDYAEAFRAAGLSVTHDALGISNRGLFIGFKR